MAPVRTVPRLREIEGPKKPSPVRQRKRAKTGKRSRPEEYSQANGMVRRGVLERWDMAKTDPLPNHCSA